MASFMPLKSPTTALFFRLLLEVALLRHRRNAQNALYLDFSVAFNLVIHLHINDIRYVTSLNELQL
jgi:hypothetical protein